MAAILAIVSELAKLLNLIVGHSNSPEMVTAKLNQVHQDLKDKVTNLEAILADPNKTEAEKQQALDQIRILES